MTITTTTATDSNRHYTDAERVNLFAQMALGVIQAGLKHAEADDPHLCATAARWITEEGGRLELRIVIDTGAGAMTIRGTVVDAGGEALADIFTFSGRPVTPQ